ncbi:MAG: glycosyltransferase family 39 protein, partial [Thermoanaerobaculia bacterium]
MKRAYRPPAALALLLLAAFLAWTGWSAALAYNFGDAAARTAAAHELAHVSDLATGLPAGLPRLFSCLLFLASALGLGSLLLLALRLRFRSRAERALLEIGAGLVAWTGITLALGSACLLRREFFLIPCAFGLAAAGWAWLRPGRGAWDPGGEAALSPPAAGTSARLRRVAEVTTGTLLALFLYLAMLGSLGPEVQFDSRWYHLAQVKHYVQCGCLFNMVAETRMAVTGLPAYHQLLMTGVATLFDVATAKLFNWFEFLLSVAMVIFFCRHHFASRLMGLVAALIFASTPLVGWMASTSANDLPLVLFSLFSLHAFLRWRAEPAARSWLVLLGALGGFAAAMKPFALSFLFILCLAVVAENLWPEASNRTWRERLQSSTAGLALVGFAALAVVSPWFLRSYLTTGNPTFPFLDGVVFDSPYWNSAVEANLRAAVRLYGVERTLTWYLLLPVRTITRAHNHRAVIGPLFLIFLPVVAAALSTARGATGALFRKLALYAALVVTLWFWSGLVETRYGAFAFPAFAMLVAYVLVEHDWGSRFGAAARAVLGVVALLVTLLNLQPFVFLQTFGTDPSIAGRLF